MTHYDRLETRAAKQRELALFRDLRAGLVIAKARAPALRRQMRSVNPGDILSRADLAKVPLLRKADLKNLQQDAPPFGGLATTRIALLKRLLVSPGPIFEPEGYARDYWGQPAPCMPLACGGARFCSTAFPTI